MAEYKALMSPVMATLEMRDGRVDFHGFSEDGQLIFSWAGNLDEESLKGRVGEILLVLDAFDIRPRHCKIETRQHLYLGEIVLP